MSQTFISDLRYTAVLARNNFHYQSITDRKRPVSVVNKLRYFFLRSFAVFIGRPQQNRDRTANEPQPNRQYAPQPNLNRTALEPRPNRNRSVRSGQYCSYTITISTSILFSEVISLDINLCITDGLI